MNSRVTTSTDLEDLEDAFDRWGKIPEPVKEKQDSMPEPNRRPWSVQVNYIGGGPEFARWDES